MTIEFSCDNCGKALSTTDDKAGRKAKCPGCGEAVLVPDVSTDDEFGADSVAPPLPTATRACPMCGAQNSVRAKTCEACGEPLKKVITRGNQKIEAGDVLSTSWNIFKQEMGLVIGAVIVAGLLNVAISLPQSVLGFIGGMMLQQGEEGTALLFQTLAWCYMPVAYLGQWFIMLGQSRLLLNVARGEHAQLGDLFSGGKYLWRMAGASILFGLMVFIGFLCLIIPGIILTLMFWPYYFVLVDEDPPGIECLSRAKEYTTGNWGAVFVLFLAAVALVILGMCAAFVGLIFTVPLASLMMAVAYCKMSGQRTAA
jgi:predicted RNA-binding Zn-ribbon protein involved in translation (DUF1610 family)